MGLTKWIPSLKLMKMLGVAWGVIILSLNLFGILSYEEFVQGMLVSIFIVVMNNTEASG